jgi:hypothetical protein
MIQSLTMQEVRVESLEKLEVLVDETRLSANSGALHIVFSKEVWDHLTNIPASEEPEAAELQELERLREHLKAFAEDNSFAAILKGSGAARTNGRPSTTWCSAQGGSSR